MVNYAVGLAEEQKEDVHGDCSDYHLNQSSALPVKRALPIRGGTRSSLFIQYAKS